MDRLISEQATIDYIVEWLYLNEFVAQDDYELPKEIEKCIKAIPSAEPYKGMTNGEVIKAVFSKAKIEEDGNYTTVFFSEDEVHDFWKEWWNSLYSKGGDKG